MVFTAASGEGGETKKTIEIGASGRSAAEEAVTDSDCAGDGRQQQSLYYGFFNKSITVQHSE